MSNATEDTHEWYDFDDDDIETQPRNARRFWPNLKTVRGLRLFISLVAAVFRFWAATGRRWQTSHFETLALPQHSLSGKRPVKRGAANVQQRGHVGGSLVLADQLSSVGGLFC